ncbi:hypothetical protein Sjap_004054 [Stephania japonica]|uniref:Uncharacterized protein n=1 Tax=Stephania japonica TaxID=461633 RepID=A0AAP0K1L5_9MAGN
MSVAREALQERRDAHGSSTPKFPIGEILWGKRRRGKRGAVVREKGKKTIKEIKRSIGPPSLRQGEGEAIIRDTLARDVAAVMEYKGLKLQEAVDWVVKNRLDWQAGMIAVSSEGEVAYGFNSNAMFRGCATEDGFVEVGIWE